MTFSHRLVWGGVWWTSGQIGGRAVPNLMGHSIPDRFSSRFGDLSFLAKIVKRTTEVVLLTILAKFGKIWPILSNLLNLVKIVKFDKSQI